MRTHPWLILVLVLFLAPLLASKAKADSSPRPVPPPSPMPAPTGLIQPLWQVREFYAQTLLHWKADRVFETQQAILTRNRLASQAPEAQPSPLTKPLIIALQPGTDSLLRDKIQALILKIPNKDDSTAAKDECPHWIELESASEKRLFCDRGDLQNTDSKAALELTQDLAKLTRDVPAQTSLRH